MNAVEKFLQPGNPLRSSSRAVISFHAMQGYFPDGDRDAIRLLDNASNLTRGIEQGIPLLTTTERPVLVTPTVAMAALVNAWVDGGRAIDDANATAGTIARSIACKSTTGSIPAGVSSIMQVKGVDCGDAYNACVQERETKILPMFNSRMDMIPACISRLTALKNLDLDGNKITKIENLDELGNLEYLNLSSNKIEKIENLDALGNLEDLGLSNNEIPASECKAFKKSAAYIVYC